MEMWLKNLLCKVCKLNVERLSNQCHWGHSFDPTAFFLLRVCLRFDTQLMDQLHGVNGFTHAHKGNLCLVNRDVCNERLKVLIYGMEFPV
jgi:hypothetical protein